MNSTVSPTVQKSAQEMKAKTARIWALVQRFDAFDTRILRAIGLEEWKRDFVFTIKGVNEVFEFLEMNRQSNNPIEAAENIEQHFHELIDDSLSGLEQLYETAYAFDHTCTEREIVLLSARSNKMTLAQGQNQAQVLYRQLHLHKIKVILNPDKAIPMAALS